MVGLICLEEPLPPNTIQHFAAYRAMVEVLRSEITIELDDNGSILEDVGEDLIVDGSDNEPYVPRSAEEKAETMRDLELIRHHAEKNNFKLEKKLADKDAGIEDYNPEIDIQKEISFIQNARKSIFTVSRCPRNNEVGAKIWHW